MSIPMAACWAMRMSSPRSICAAPIMKKRAWARTLWISSFAKAVRQDARVELFNVSGEARRVEQGHGGTVLRQPVAQIRQPGRIARQGDGQRFILSFRLCHQLRQVDSTQQAGRHARRITVALA